MYEETKHKNTLERIKKELELNAKRKLIIEKKFLNMPKCPWSYRDFYSLLYKFCNGRKKRRKDLIWHVVKLYKKILWFKARDNRIENYYLENVISRTIRLILEALPKKAGIFYYEITEAHPRYPKFFYKNENKIICFAKEHVWHSSGRYIMFKGETWNF